MVWPVEKATKGLSLEEVAVRASHKVLMKVDDNIFCIVGDPPGIMDLQLKPYSIHLLKVIILYIISIKLYYI
jgi:hypothetical protein